MPADAAFDEAALATVRRAYARQMLAVAGADGDHRLEEAFASVPRERFLGAPPWRMVHLPSDYVTLPDADPVLAYQDVLFALMPERGINNGSPSLHARWLHGVRIGPGEHVAHIGAGTGYYTTLMAHLVGGDGGVTAVELDPSLAVRARENLGGRVNVTVIQGDGSAWPRDDADVVYVNFSVERPAAAWLERLRPGGRLIFPLGVPRAEASGRGGRQMFWGAALLIERRTDRHAFAAKWLGPAYFVRGEGEVVGTAEDRAALDSAFAGGGIESVRSLRWGAPAAPGRSWFVGAGWSLGYDEVG